MIDSPDTKQFFWRIRKDIWICLIMTAAILAVYVQVTHYGFIGFDDHVYVSANRHVKSGISSDGFLWSLTTMDLANWHPLTWLSHMLDVELYGLDAGGHHLTNILFHIANTLLLFILLKAMTDAFWPSVFVAALFGLHPLHVESVAWISERKDVLSTFWGMLSLISYVRYTQQRSRTGYGLALLFFILGLMAKPMLVTWPFLMILLDYWPLKRFEFAGRFYLRPSAGVSTLYSLILEKLPFFVLTAASCVVTYYAQQSGGAMIPFDGYPISIRVANAVVAYGAYVGKMLWPFHLAVFYPLSSDFTFWQVAAASAILLGISLGALMQIRQRPYMAVGWFWYLGTLVPVIGLVQVGGQSMADRYTYIPLIGLFIMIAWGCADILDRFRIKQIFALPAAITLILALSIVARIQVDQWENNITLYSHALKVTRNNYLAHLNLGKALNDAGKDRQAFEHYSAALQIHPDFTYAHVNYGSALLAQGKVDAAIDHFYQALRIKPDFAEAHNNLGLALVRIGKIEESIHHFRLALKANPNFANAKANLNLATSINDKINRAVRRMQESLQIDALSPDFDLKMIELSKRKRDVFYAVGKYRTALSRQPGFSGLDRKNLPLVEAVMQEYEGLLPVLLEKIKFQSTGAEAYYHIACIYARKGRLHESNKWVSRAKEMNRDRWHFFKTDPDLVQIQKSGADSFRSLDAAHCGVEILQNFQTRSCVV